MSAEHGLRIDETATERPASAPPIVSTFRRPDRVAVITYDSPGLAGNVVGVGALAELERALDEIDRDPLIVAALLVSGKPERWIDGWDLSAFEGFTTATEGEAVCRAGHRVASKL